MTKIEYYQYDKLPAKVKTILRKSYDIDSELFEHQGAQAVLLDISDSIDCVKQYKLYMSKRVIFTSVILIKSLQLKCS